MKLCDGLKKGKKKLTVAVQIVRCDRVPRARLDVVADLLAGAT